VLSEQHAHFDELFTKESDPWGYRTEFAEQRRHQLLLAVLESSRYSSVFEPGCANGTLTELLAGRADRVLAWDASAQAIKRARSAVGSISNIRVEQGSVPDRWPGETFDLIVLSDFLYYLDSAAARRVVEKSAESLVAGGFIVVCHWLGSAHDFRIPGGVAVHGLVESVLGPATGPVCLDDRQIIAGWRG
jgi:SAM-dependent methyltransferase